MSFEQKDVCKESAVCPVLAEQVWYTRVFWLAHVPLLLVGYYLFTKAPDSFYISHFMLFAVSMAFTLAVIAGKAAKVRAVTHSSKEGEFWDLWHGRKASSLIDYSQD